MFSMMYDANFTYDSSMPIYENSPPPFPYTLDYKMAHDCMIPPCPKKAYPGKRKNHPGLGCFVVLRAHYSEYIITNPILRVFLGFG